MAKIAGSRTARRVADSFEEMLEVMDELMGSVWFLANSSEEGFDNNYHLENESEKLVNMWEDKKGMRDQMEQVYKLVEEYYDFAYDNDID